MQIVQYILRAKNGEAYGDPESYAGCLEAAREIWRLYDFREVAGIYYGELCITSAHELDLDFDEETNDRFAYDKEQALAFRRQ